MSLHLLATEFGNQWQKSRTLCGHNKTRLGLHRQPWRWQTHSNLFRCRSQGTWTLGLYATTITGFTRTLLPCSRYRKQFCVNWFWLFVHTCNQILVHMNNNLSKMDENWYRSCLLIQSGNLLHIYRLFWKSSSSWSHTWYQWLCQRAYTREIGHLFDWNFWSRDWILGDL